MKEKLLLIHASFRWLLILVILLSPIAAHCKCPLIQFKISGIIIDSKGIILDAAKIVPFFNDDQSPASFIKAQNCYSDNKGIFNCDLLFVTARSGRQAIYDVGDKIIRGDDCGGEPSKVEIIIVKDGYPLWRASRAIRTEQWILELSSQARCVIL
jgi:hypothetical protein